MTECQRLKIRGVLPLLHEELYYILLQMVLCVCVCSFSYIHIYTHWRVKTSREGGIQATKTSSPRILYRRSHVMNSPAGIFAYFARGLITRPSGIQSRLPPCHHGLGIASPRAAAVLITISSAFSPLPIHHPLFHVRLAHTHTHARARVIYVAYTLKRARTHTHAHVLHAYTHTHSQARQHARAHTQAARTTYMSRPPSSYWSRRLLINNKTNNSNNNNIKHCNITIIIILY